MAIHATSRAAARLVLLAAASMLAITACRGGSGGTGSAGDSGSSSVTRATAQQCGIVSKTALAASAPITVLVVDNTASGPAGRGALPVSVKNALQRAQAKDADLVILGVNGSGANPLPVKEVALNPEPRHTSRDADAARAIAIDCVSQWISTPAATPDRPGSDVLAAVDEAVRHAPASIIVMSDGLDTVDPLDLNKIGFASDPASVVSSLQSTRSIDHAAARTPLLWADLGVTVKPVPGVVRSSLKALWTAILQSAGLTVTFAPDETQAGSPAHQSPADPLKLPAVTTAISGCHTTLTVPTDLLFRPGASHLDAAPGVLSSALRPLSQPGASAVISGHTAAYGTTPYRYNLSVARAEAVAGALESEGVSPSRLTVVGYGATRPAENEFPGGRHDLAAAAANRRVVIDIRHEGCA